MIGECDVFYPLQTKIGDWYPPKKAPPPPPPQNEVDDEEDDDVKQGVLPSNLGPIPPNEPQPMNPAPPQPLPILPQDQGNGKSILFKLFLCVSKLIEYQNVLSYSSASKSSSSFALFTDAFKSSRRYESITERSRDWHHAGSTCV